MPIRLNGEIDTEMLETFLERENEAIETNKERFEHGFDMANEAISQLREMINNKKYENKGSEFSLKDLEDDIQVNQENLDRLMMMSQQNVLQKQRLDKMSDPDPDRVCMTIPADTKRENIVTMHAVVLRKLENPEISEQEKQILTDLQGKLETAKEIRRNPGMVIPDVVVFFNNEEKKFIQGLVRAMDPTAQIETQEQAQARQERARQERARQELIDANTLAAQIGKNLVNEANELRRKGHAGTAVKLEASGRSISRAVGEHNTAGNVFKALNDQLSKLSTDIKTHHEVSHGFRSFLRNAMNGIKRKLGIKESQAPGIEKVEPENLIREAPAHVSFAFKKFRENQRPSTQEGTQRTASVSSTVREDEDQSPSVPPTTTPSTRRPRT